MILQRNGSGQGQTTHSCPEQHHLPGCRQPTNAIGSFLRRRTDQLSDLSQRGDSTRSKTPSNLCRQQRESERTTSPTLSSTTRTRAKGRGRIQRRLGRLEWLCFDDKCNKLDALSCSSTLVSFFTRFQVSCADISPSFSHLMLDNSAGDIKGCLLYTSDAADE